jgi:hypothetical protein
MTAPAKRPAGTSPAVLVKRIRFVAQPAAGARVLRRFTQPRSCAAIEESGADNSDRPTWPEPTDHLDVVFVAPGSGREPGPGWLSPPDHSDAVPAATVERPGVSVEWRPGRALVRASADMHDEILAALADFAFYEGELRTLERDVESRLTNAGDDVPRAYVIRRRDRKHWPRFVEMIESFSRMRVTFARLEPQLAKGSRTLSPEARRIMSRLLVRADAEERLEALNDRLETGEDLYEGASDRVVEYRSYRTGHRLELGIICLLLAEVILILVDLYIHYREFNASE